MRTRYELEPLSATDATRWDELITPYKSHQLFHRQTWLDYLAASRQVDIRQWRIQEHGQTVGYFCGGLLRKGPFRILGSPLKGWGTNFMGPVAEDTFDGEAFVRALDDLATCERLAMVEIESPAIDGVHLEAAGYEAAEQQTYVVELTPKDPEHMWSRLDLKSRQKVRKAQRAGLTVEETTSRELAEEFYDEFIEVLARKGLSPPYGAECPALLLRALGPAGLVFGLLVRDPDGVPIATGIFPHDDRTVYFWGGASRLAGWRFSPNDLVQWTAMERAAARGVSVYNMCGYGHFKSKFGGVLERPRRWHKSYSRVAGYARRGYAVYFERRIRLQGWWARTTRPSQVED